METWGMFNWHIEEKNTINSFDIFQMLIFYGLWSFFYLTAASAVTHYAANYENRSGWYAATVSYIGFISFRASCVMFLLLFSSLDLLLPLYTVLPLTIDLSTGRERIPLRLRLPISQPKNSAA